MKKEKKEEMIDKVFRDVRNAFRIEYYKIDCKFETPNDIL